MVKRDEADRYVAYLKDDTFPHLASLAGFVRATILRRDVAGGTEFQIVTVWDSLQEIEAFAGVDIDRAVVPPVVKAMMVDFDRRVVHYEIVGTFEPRVRGA